MNNLVRRHQLQKIYCLEKELLEKTRVHFLNKFVMNFFQSHPHNLICKFIFQRRKGLEVYLTQILLHLHRTPLPLSLIEFCSFDEYDVNFAIQKLSLKISKGEISSQSWTFTIFELHSITSRIKQPKNNFELYDPNYDFSHILDFCGHLRCLKIVPTKNHAETKEDYVQQLIHGLGTSNILPSTLTFELSTFTKVETLEFVGIVPQNVTECDSVKRTVTHLNVNFTRVQNIQQILSPGSIHENCDDDKWSRVKLANFGYNDIWTIDQSMRNILNVEELHLNDNRLQKISNLKSLHKLVLLNLSGNLIESLEGWNYEIGNVEILQLSSNKLKSLKGLSKLRSLQVLDLSMNEIDNLDEISEIAQLPLIENVNLNGNPLALLVDYRAKVLSMFADRCTEIILDNEKCSQEELDKAMVLNALRQTKIC